MDTVKAAFTTYLSHLAGYIIAGVTVVSTLAPGTIPPKYAFITAIATGLVTAFSHGKAVQANAGSIAAAMANAFNDAVAAAAVPVPQPAPAPSPATVVAAGIKVAVAMLVLAATLPYLHGCASTQAWLGTPTGEAVTIAGVQVAVTTAEQKGVSAAQINSVAKSIIADVQMSTVTLATMTATLNAELIKLKVPAGDVAAFQGLELAFDAYLVGKYGNNPTVQNLSADIILFCQQAVIDTGG